MATLAQRNTQKAQLIYQVIDQSGGFYRGHSHPDHRSQMNITFTLADATLEKSFLSLAEAAGMVGLAGHRSVGGLRASLYNALPLTSAQALADMMREFQRTHG
jgi:phosphoserine aminotransferase